MSLLSRFKDWRARRAQQREWPLEACIEHARRLIQDDAHWMGHEPIVRVLCERYLTMLSTDWYRTQFEDTVTLRRRLCLDPHAPMREAMPLVPEDPLNWPLPCDIVIGGGRLRKGVKLRALVDRTKTLYGMATGSDADEVANRTPEERQARFRAFQERVGIIPADTTPPITEDQDAGPDTQILPTRQ